MTRAAPEHVSAHGGSGTTGHHAGGVGALSQSSRWLFGATLDVAAFGGSAVLALGLVAIGRILGWSRELPDWGWLLFVLGVDVAHVYATLFRTYLDGAELRRHPARYTLVPLGVYAAGVVLHHAGALVFWRVLAYLATFHFVRQQVGWAALYRARAGEGRVDRFVDDAALYVATGYPLLHWHAHLHAAESRIAWLVRGDYVDVSAAALGALPVGRVVYAAALLAFLARQVTRGSAWHRGKSLLVATTAATWWVGIVGVGDDFAFTVTNVLPHGVPYLVLLWTYSRERRAGTGASLSATLSASLGVFLGVLGLLAFIEEAGWDLLVWHDRPWLFGEGVMLSPALAAFVVPLLAVPQGSHYVLDGLLWRRREGEPASAWTRARAPRYD